MNDKMPVEELAVYINEMVNCKDDMHPIVIEEDSLIGDKDE